MEGEGADEILVLPSDAANICCVTFSPDGHHLAVGNGGYSAGGTGIVGRIWDILRTGGGERLTLAGTAGDVAWSPTGDVIAYGIEGVAAEMGGVALRDSATGRPIRTFRLEALATGLVFSPDGKTIAASGGFGAAIGDVETGRTVSLEGHTDWVQRVDVSTDGMRAATTSWDQTARIWNARTGRLESTIKLDTSGRDIAFSPDGSLIATAEAEAGVSAFRLWNASTGKEVRTLLRPSAFANAVAFSPDGRFVAGGLGDGTLHVWKVSGEEVFAVPAHGGEVLSLAFDRAGSRIVTGSRDQLVKVWDARTGAHILTLTGHAADVIGAAFSPDGRYVISSSWDGTVRVWILDIDELLELARTRVKRSLTDDECRRYLHPESCAASTD
jgi:WD40 repeat protein